MSVIGNMKLQKCPSLKKCTALYWSGFVASTWANHYDRLILISCFRHQSGVSWLWKIWEAFSCVKCHHWIVNSVKYIMLNLTTPQTVLVIAVVVVGQSHVALNQRMSHTNFFLNLGTKMDKCRYRLTGEHSILLGTGMVSSYDTQHQGLVLFRASVWKQLHIYFQSFLLSHFSKLPSVKHLSTC